jgi:hypothetical protein
MEYTYYQRLEHLKISGLDFQSPAFRPTLGPTRPPIQPERDDVSSDVKRITLVYLGIGNDDLSPSTRLRGLVLNYAQGELYLYIYLLLNSPFVAQRISPSEGRYLHTGQHKYRINENNTDTNASSGIRTHDPSVEWEKTFHASRGHCWFFQPY